MAKLQDILTVEQDRRPAPAAFQDETRNSQIRRLGQLTNGGEVPHVVGISLPVSCKNCKIVLFMDGPI